jgi:hypothetical protein
MLASVREQVAKKMFEQLSTEEQEEWASQAKEEHQEEMKEWKEQTTRPPSAGPSTTSPTLYSPYWMESALSQVGKPR